MNGIRRICVILIGLTLILSSWLKLLDPTGTGLIMVEYFKFLHINFLIPIAKPVGVAISLLEGITGTALLAGVWPRITAGVTIALLAFFTVISTILLVYNPSMDCGCFGQAIHLSHAQTFAKNIILCVLACISFIPIRTLQLTCREHYLSFGICSVILLLFSVASYNQTPLFDFTEFKPSHTIVLEEHLLDDNFEYPTLSLTDADGMDHSADILDGRVALISIYNPEKISQSNKNSIASFAQEAVNAGYTPILVSTEAMEIAGIDFCLTADYKKLLTLNRSNGGVTFLDNGFIVRKRGRDGLLSYDQMVKMASMDSGEAYVDSSMIHAVFLQTLCIGYIIALLLL